jgi:PAS domain S-box-containing protein
MAVTDILIVEDNKSVVRELREQLDLLGYKVVDVASSGGEAIEKTRTRCPHIVLMNIRLKGTVDSLQAGRDIRDEFDIPVIYLMDHSSQATIRRAGTTGPFGYIFRPFDGKQIFATIEIAVIRHRLERQLQQSKQWLNTTLTSIGDGVIATDEQGLVRFINPPAMEQLGWHHTEAVGKPLSQVFSLVDERTQEPIDILDQPNRISSTVANPGVEGLLIRRDHATIPVEANITSIEDRKGKVYGMVLLFRDVTQQRESMQEIKRQANRAEALLQVASQLNSHLELKTVLHTICEMTNRALKATGSIVVLQKVQRETFRVMASISHDPMLKASQESPFEIPREIFESILSREKPAVVIQDAQGEPSLSQFDSFKQAGVRTIAVAALFRGKDLIGALVSVFTQHPKTLLDDDIALLRGLADQASSAIENAELFEQVRAGRERQRKLAKSLVEIQEAERRNIAIELHDHLGQLLTGLQFMLETTKNQTSGKQRSDLEEIQGSVSDIISQVREMSLNLRPSMLDDLGLVHTLKWHFERFTRQTGIHINFQGDKVRSRFPAEIETTAYRIVQEALTNVARHAQVKSVFVGLALQPDTLWVEVVDYGRGFDMSSTAERPSSGLDGMRERAELAGGYLVIRSVLGQGTQVIAALPILDSRLERRKYARQASID